MIRSQPRIESQSSSLRLNRDDDQLLALSYENLCDSDYLQKLLSIDGYDSDLTDLFLLSKSPSDPNYQLFDQWVLIGDSIEDLLVFGNVNKEFGCKFLKRRNLYEMVSKFSKTLDGSSLSLHRQISVYRYIREVVLKKSTELHNSSLLSFRIPSISKHFVDISMGCSLQVLRCESRNGLPLKAVESLTKVVANVVSGGLSPDLNSFQFLSICRDIFLRSFNSTFKKMHELQDPSSSLEVLMCCVYAELIIAYFLDSPGDFLLATAHLVCINARAREIEVQKSNCVVDGPIPIEEIGIRKSKKHSSKLESPLNSKGMKKTIASPQPSQLPVSGNVTSHGNSELDMCTYLITPKKDLPKKQSTLKKSIVESVDPEVLSNNIVVMNVAFSPSAPVSISTPKMDENIESASGNISSSQKSSKLSTSHLRVPRSMIRILGKNANRFDKLLGNSFQNPQNSSKAYVWSCGQNSYGELGLDDTSQRKNFSKLTLLEDKKIVGVGAGNEHTIFLSDDGKIFTCGYNDNGQCGTGWTQQVKLPTLIRGPLENENISGVFAFNGCEHTLLKTNDGKVFAFGYNYRGQLGLGSTSSEPTPKPLKGLLSKKISKISCSYHHSLFYCTDGMLYSCGRNDCGQLGHGDTVDKKIPHLVSTAPRSISDMSCGQFHSCAVTDNGELYLCGKNDYGQLGFENVEIMRNFSKLSIENEKIIQVMCGYYHTLILTATNLVYGFGRNDYGQLGLGHVQARIHHALLIPSLRDKNVVKLSCGCYHSIAITGNGMLYVFGRNNHGQLGTGDVEERHFPHSVDDFVGKRVIDIAAGFYHTVALVEDNNSIECHSSISDVVPLKSCTDTTRIIDASSGSQIIKLLQLMKSDPKMQDNDQRFSFSLDHKTKATSLELFNYLVSILPSLCRSKGIAVDGCDDQNCSEYSKHSSGDIIWATKIILYISTLIEFCRTSFGDGDLQGIISMEEASVLLQSSMSILSSICSQFRSDFSRILNSLDQLSEFHDRKLDFASLNEMFVRPSVLHYTSYDSLFKLCSYMSDETSQYGKDFSHGEDLLSVGNLLWDCLQKLRSEVFVTYFHISNDLQFQSHSCCEAADLCLEFIVRYFDLLFPFPSYSSAFFKYMGGHLTAVRSDDVICDTPHFDPECDHIDYFKCFQLFCRVCFRYRSVNDVLSLISLSSYDGLVIFQQLLSVYNLVSMMTLERRIPSGLNITLGEISKFMNLLEHSNTTFCKVAVPVILSFTLSMKSSNDSQIYQLGVTIIRDILNAAVQVAQFLLVSCSSFDDFTVVLRNNTVIPSILPSAMLFCASSSPNSSDSCLLDLIPSFQSLVVSFQQLGKVVQDGEKSASNLKKDMGVESNKRDLSNQMIGNQPTWWSRIIKLSSSVLCNIASSLILPEIRDINSFGVDSTSHSIWKYFNPCLHYRELSVPTIFRIGENDVWYTMRDLYMNSDLMYHSLWISIKNSPIAKEIETIERLLITPAIYAQYGGLWNVCVQNPLSFRKLLSQIWSSVTRCTKQLLSSKSRIIENGDISISWIDVVNFVSNSLKRLSMLLYESIDECRKISPYFSLKSLSNSKKRWRRCLLVVIGVVRWRRATLSKYSRAGSVAVQFMWDMISDRTKNFTNFTSEISINGCQFVFDQLRAENDVARQRVSGIDLFISIFSNSSYASVKCDMMVQLISLWSHAFVSLDGTPGKLSHERWNCCSHDMFNLNRSSLRSFLIHISKYIRSFKTSCVGSSSNDFLLLSLSIDFFNLICTTSWLNIPVSDYLPLSLLQSLFLFLDDKVAVESQLISLSNPGPQGTVNHLFHSSFSWEGAVSTKIVGDEARRQFSDNKSSSQMKKVLPKERIRSMKIAASSIISLVQGMVMEKRNGTFMITSSDELFDLIAVSSFFLEKCRVLSLLCCKNENDLGSPKDSKDPKDSSTYNKKRCQDIINKPMEFCKNSEGIVVQGDKLLSSSKGVDFTLTFWVFLSKSNENKTCFLSGKVSHNDAWPLVIIRADAKIEVLFGHGNEFEKFSSQSSFGFGVWNHVAIVVEQKKIKLFLNGVFDNQTAISKINSRAILYPLLIGTCPQGLRTRVDSVKEGFDGFISQYKYHTRAISPIHIKVVFDQGPPDSYDIREKWVYRLLGCASLLQSPEAMTNLPHLIASRVIDSLLMIFVTDSVSRIRCASFTILRQMLLNCDISACDLTLSSNMTGQASSFASQIPIRQAVFMKECSNIYECFVLYVIRILGCCYSPAVFALFGSNSHSVSSEAITICGNNIEKGRLREFLAYAPAIFLESNQTSIINTSKEEPTSNFSSSSNDKTQTRDDQFSEIAAHLLNFLREIADSSFPAWHNAVRVVSKNILSTLRGSIFSTSDLFSMLRVDALGVSIFLGGCAHGVHLGLNAKSIFSETPGRVFHINRSTGAVVIVSESSSDFRYRINNLQYQNVIGFPKHGSLLLMDKSLCLEAISALDSLRHPCKLLIHDILANYTLDHPLLRHVFLKLLRPWEALVFHQLLSYLNQQLTLGHVVESYLEYSNAIRSLLSGKIDLMNFLQQCATRTYLVKCPVPPLPAVETIGSNDAKPDDQIYENYALKNDSSEVPLLWPRCFPYISSIPYFVKLHSFPVDENVIWMNDYCRKFPSLESEFSTRKFSDDCMTIGSFFASIFYREVKDITEPSKSGYCSLFDANFSDNEISFPIYATDWSNYSLSDSNGPVVNLLDNHIPLGSLSESDKIHALSFLGQSRKSLIVTARNILNLCAPSSFHSTTKPCNLSLQMHVVMSLATDESFTLSSLNDLSRFCTTVQERAYEWRLASSREVSDISIRCIYNCSSFSTVYLREGNFEILLRIFRWTYFWLTCFSGFSSELDIIFQFLVQLLPCVSDCIDRIISTNQNSLEIFDCEVCRLYLYLLSRFHVIYFKSKDNAEDNNSEKIMNLFSEVSLILKIRLVSIKILKSNRARSLPTHINDTPDVNFSITQLSSLFDMVQRDISGQSFLKQPPISSLDGSSFCSLLSSSPKVSNITTSSFVLNFEDCINILLTEAKTIGFILSNHEISLEIEMAAKGYDDNEPEIYESVYFGVNCVSYTHSEILPGCKYCIRSRFFWNGLRTEWSNPIQIVTKDGVVFKFDELLSGPDIQLSENRLTATYHGDDMWSTVLCSQSFSSGIVSWSVRVNHSSTAYIFVGIATSSADLNTFLGGCSQGWGYIGEQALYHNREKVKIYGESFTAGDVITVHLDFNEGTLSFSKNGKALGVAFDKIFGEIYPAFAFYNEGQEFELVSNECKMYESLPPFAVSPMSSNLLEFSLLMELVSCLSYRVPFSFILLEKLVENLNHWISGSIERFRSSSGRYLYLSQKSSLLSNLGLSVKDRIRTPFGVATISGTLNNRIWFSFESGVWFFTEKQVVDGRLNGYFTKCSYSADQASNDVVGDSNGDNLIPFDVMSLHSIFDPTHWSAEMDAVIVEYLVAQSEILNLSPWNIPSKHIFADFRVLQQRLSKIVMNDLDLTHKWGISGPKRRQVIARVSMLQWLNHMIEQYLVHLIDETDILSSSFKLFRESLDPRSLISRSNSKFSPTSWKDDGVQPTTMSVDCEEKKKHHPLFVNSDLLTKSLNIRTRWLNTQTEPSFENPLLSIKHSIFPKLKFLKFWSILNSSALRTAKTEDDYDYPEDLPQIKINRLKSFRAREASEIFSIPGEDLFFSSIFCQLWKELRQFPGEKLRICYAHPMDDGQSRTFKIKFEGEGVDDYGGPYREVLQQVCDELQFPDPSALAQDLSLKAGNPDNGVGYDEHSLFNRFASNSVEDVPPVKCFIPLLIPTLNWSCSNCEEKYKYTFNPSSCSIVRMDLYRFLGQIIGIAVRSRITLDISLPSMIWKCVVGEKLTEIDLKSIDFSTYEFLTKIYQLYSQIRLLEEQQSSSSVDKSLDMLSLTEELQAIIEDVYWTATRSDGVVVELIPGGSSKSLSWTDIELYCKKMTEVMLSESAVAIECFRSGVYSVLPQHSLMMFSGAEFERIVCGNPSIDVSRLKENTEYDEDITPDDPFIVIFWDVLESFTEEEKSAFLRFVWARPTLPPKEVEFTQKFKIQSGVGDDCGDNPDQYLPKAHTCFFSLNLPKYSSKEVS